MDIRYFQDWLKWELADSELRAEDSEDEQFDAGFIAALKFVINRIEGE